MIGDRTNDQLNVEERVRTLEYGVHDRLVALENDNRRLRAMVRLLAVGTVAALALALTLFLAPGAAISNRTIGTLAAKRWLLVDDAGLARGEWTVQQDGTTRLVLNDDRGVARLRLSVVKGGLPGLAFADSKAQARAALGILPDESANLVFADPDGATRAVFGVRSRDQSATLVFADRNGVTRAGLGVTGDGLGTFTLQDTAAPESDAASDSAAGGAPDSTAATPAPKN